MDLEQEWRQSAVERYCGNAEVKVEKNYPLKRLLIISLKDQKKFDLVNKCGAKFHSKSFLLVGAKNFSEIPSVSPNAIFLGMKVSKKLGIAVIRNKIKRRIRHAIQILSKNPKFPPGITAMIIIPRKGFEKIIFTVLLDEFNKALSSLRR